MRRNTQKQKYLVLGALVLLISLGYAFLSVNLKIDGVTNIGNSQWDVHFDNVIVRQFRLSGTATATDVEGVTPSITGESYQQIEYEVTLNQPGDTYEFTADIVNEGSIDAEVDAVVTKVILDGESEEVTLTDANMPEFLEYSVTWDDDSEIESGYRLNSGDTKTIKVQVKYKADISNDVYERAQGQTIEFKLSLDYVQADVGASSSSNSGIYTLSMSNYGESSTQIGEAIPNDVTRYATPALAMKAWENYNVASSEYYGNDFTGRPFFLKHVLGTSATATADGGKVITESYVGFVVTSKMASDNSGMKAGTYYLRGGVDESNDSSYENANSIYQQNVATLKEAFGENSGYCSDSTSFFECDVSGLNANANSYGNVHAYVASATCSVEDDGNSGCGV